MATGNVRAHKPTLRKLQQMREQSGESTADLLEVAVDLLERDRFLDSANAAYAALRDQPEAWAQEQEERAAWEVTLSDDLQPEQ